MNKTAVLLLQMGGPDSLDAIEPFLYNLFSDRDIIRIGPAFLQPVIARFISRRRSKKVAGYYRQIGGRSPIRELTEQQAARLEDALGSGYRCFVAMRYWKPFTDEALAAIRAEDINKIIVLPLYPHYSRATSGSSLNELQRCLELSGNNFSLKYIQHFFDHPLYIQALVDRINTALGSFTERSGVQLLFSAHGLPQSFIDSGDPYLEHIQATVRQVMRSFGDITHHLAFQSRAGPVKWLEPSTEDTITKLAASGCKQLLVVPLSFVSDHIETLYEIDIQYRQEAQALGIHDFRRIESLNASPLFIECLAELVRNAAS